MVINYIIIKDDFRSGCGFEINFFLNAGPGPQFSNADPQPCRVFLRSFSIPSYVLRALFSLSGSFVGHALHYASLCLEGDFTFLQLSEIVLKVPKCEIFDRSDFHDFYPIKSLWEGDFGVKIKCFKKYI